MPEEIIRPLVVGTLTSASDVEDQIKQARLARVDLIEVRLDTFPFLYFLPEPACLRVAYNLLQFVSSRSGRPILLTVRSQSERGGFPGPSLSDEFRGRCYRALLPFCRMIDVEIRHAALARTMTAAAHRKHVNVIHSYHNFESMPPLKKLDSYVRLSRRWKGDVFKVAVTPKTADELESFLNWGNSLKNMKLALIAMGPLGDVSRVLGFSFGSLITYGHLGKAAAPGQWPAAALARTIRDIYR